MQWVRERAVRIVKFSGVGVICASLNIWVLWLSTYVLGIHYMIAVTFSFFFVNLVGYGLNRAITFRDRRLERSSRVGRYYLVMGSSLVLNMSLMALLVDGAGVSVIDASIAVTLVFVVFNYLGHSAWTYADARGHRVDGES